MKYKILRLGMLITMCVFFVINTMEVYAITSPPSTDLVQAFSGDDKANFDENTDIYFIYSDIPISKIESEDELKNIIEQANTDELDTHRGAWVVRQWQIQEREYFERVLVYDDNEELYEPIIYRYDRKEDTIPALMSDLLGEQYNINTKNILLFGLDSNTPFASELLVKVFDDGSVKIGTLINIKRDKISVKKGWYTLDEIKHFIEVWQSEGATPSNATSSNSLGLGGGHKGPIDVTKIFLITTGIIGSVLVAGFIVYKKYRKNILK